MRWHSWMCYLQTIELWPFSSPFKILSPWLISRRLQWDFQSAIPSGKPTVHHFLLSHSLDQQLLQPCFCFSLSQSDPVGQVLPHMSTATTWPATLPLLWLIFHSRVRLLWNPWDLGFQPAGASPCLHSFQWRELGNSTLLNDGPTQGLLGLTVLQNLMSQLFGTYLQPTISQGTNVPLAQIQNTLAVLWPLVS